MSEYFYVPCVCNDAYVCYTHMDGIQWAFQALIVTFTWKYIILYKVGTRSYIICLTVPTFNQLLTMQFESILALHLTRFWCLKFEPYR